MKKKLNQFKKIVLNHKKVSIGIIIILIVFIVAIVTLVINNNEGSTSNKKKEDKLIVNTNAGIIKEEEYKGLKFSNITLIKAKDTETYTLSMDVTNTTSETSNITQVDIPIKNKKGEVEVTLLGYIGEDLKPNETRTITASAGIDLSKSASKEIKEHNQQNSQ